MLKKLRVLRAIGALAVVLAGALGLGWVRQVSSASVPAVSRPRQPVQGTPYFTIVYGTVRVGGGDAPVGTVVEARSPRGDTVGRFEVQAAGYFGAMYAYGEDAGSPPAIPGVRAGEEVTFYVDGRLAAASSPLVWQDDRAPHLVDLSVELGHVFLPCVVRDIEEWR